MINGNVTVWKWIAGALLALCTFLGGGAVGDWRASNAIEKVAPKVEANTRASAVMDTRIKSIEKQLDRIENKLDKALDAP